jgi:uncharacterized phage infection (PIP) family protein YhgE
MMSQPASVTSHLQELDLDEPQEVAKIPLRNKGLDIASQMQSVEQAGPDLASAVGDYSTSVDQTLGVIEALEATLQQKRRQIEEIQTRQEILALEYRQLGRSLDTATKDLAQQFADIITDLETDKAIAKPPADQARETSETSGPIAEPPADSTPETDEASGLDLETSDLPPVPEFLGGRQDSSDPMDDITSRDTGSGPRGWWKHAKKR